MRKRNKVSMRKIADELGVSPAMVSIVLNKRTEQYQVSEENQKRITAKAAELGYNPKSNKKARKKVLIINPFGGIRGGGYEKFNLELINQIQGELDKSGWEFIFASSNIKTNEYYTEDQLNQTSAMIIQGLHENDDYKKLIDAANSANVLPIVTGRYFSGRNALYVDIDHYAGGRLVAEHLYDLGHANIAIMMGLDDQHGNKRLSGFLDFYREKDINIKEEMIWRYGEYNITGGYNLTKKKYEEGLRPSAIFYMNNSMGMGGIYALQNLGVNIPNDISVVTFDNSSELDNINPGLTTIDFEIGNTGRSLANIIKNMIANDDRSQLSISAPVKLIERNSTKQNATQNNLTQNN